MIIEIKYPINKGRIYYEKNREKILLQKQNNICIQFRDLVISYVELENRLKALEENLKNVSENKTDGFLKIEYIYINILNGYL